MIREPLGEGGYGQVFRAYDPHLDRDVALKVLKPNRLGEKALERFYREARAAARLDHPNIVGLHDAGRDDDRCWIAYQLVPGRTLSLIRDTDRPSIHAVGPDRPRPRPGARPCARPGGLPPRPQARQRPD